MVVHHYSLLQGPQKNLWRATVWPCLKYKFNKNLRFLQIVSLKMANIYFYKFHLIKSSKTWCYIKT